MRIIEDDSKKSMTNFFYEKLDRFWSQKIGFNLGPIQRGRYGIKKGH